MSLRNAPDTKWFDQDNGDALTGVVFDSGVSATSNRDTKTWIITAGPDLVAGGKIDDTGLVGAREATVMLGLETVHTNRDLSFDLFRLFAHCEGYDVPDPGPASSISNDETVKYIDAVMDDVAFAALSGVLN